ncbi:bifunctional riboflavin kinase/FMN phosphatase-like [Telopea speciosissima]|uniref:bifunctional riboflavin kinase/FMN phosphatase-like n=1 Tax=Telopea speciosissima TaxID=54955 RepID=UPI001CC43A61|nr:bifunctional riboflavin kinase/FMN phosphatase-like [Telopea speciosissima]XP_043690304.1 bifunctional riboflavin kinase/FMN phosphatase-like [Telopea speciosissima]
MNCCDSQSCNSETQILAVILDLDGTLLDTEKTTKYVVKDFLAKYGKILDREKEDKRLGQMHKESAASIVKDYDLPLTPDQFSKEIMPMYKERWPQAKALPGVNRLLMHLHKHGVPFALASNSIRKHIDEKLYRHEGWKELFSVILGSNDVNSGKPSPDLFLEAAKRMGVDPLRCLVIEDSLPGVMAAKSAGMKVVAVPSLQTQADRYSIATYVLHSLLEFQPEIWGLPPFDDWVENALPIEPMYVKAVASDGFLSEVSDNDSTSLPDQISGVYFGWAKLGTSGIFKAVVSIGWHGHSVAAKQVILPYLIDETEEYTTDQPWQLLLVGYIRELSGEVNTSLDIEILEEDKSIAMAALDLPVFAHHRGSPLLAE